MAKFGEVVTAAKPAYTTSFQHFMERIEELNYPIEVYKDGYFRVLNAHREHWQALRDGWSEEKEPGMDYRPISAHPDSIAKAKKQQADLIAAQEAQKRTGESKLVSMSEVRDMIAAATRESVRNFSQPEE